MSAHTYTPYPLKAGAMHIYICMYKQQLRERKKSKTKNYALFWDMGSISEVAIMHSA